MKQRKSYRVPEFIIGDIKPNNLLTESPALNAWDSDDFDTYGNIWGVTI